MAKFKLALTFGRFNLLHIGHLDLFSRMAEMADEVIIGVSTHESNLSLRDRTQTITHALNKDERFKVPYQIIPKRQPFELAPEIKPFNPEDVVFYVGEDQYELSKSISKHWGVAIVLIERLTSSTTVRTLVDNQEWALLAQIVPQSILNKVIQLRETERCLSSH